MVQPPLTPLAAEAVTWVVWVSSEKPLVEYSILIVEIVPVVAQAIVAELPTVKIWPAPMPGVGLWGAIVPLTVKFASETPLVGGRFGVFASEALILNWVEVAVGAVQP